MQRFNIIKRDRVYHILVKKGKKKRPLFWSNARAHDDPLSMKKVGVLLLFSLNGVLHVVHCSSPPPPTSPSSKVRLSVSLNP